MISPGSSIGPYQILSKLGVGGMGEVYRARDSRLHRQVAIKLLPAAFATDAGRLLRFQEEASAAAQLNHSNILTVFDVGTHGDLPYLVTELLEGQTLRDRLQQGSLPWRKAVEFAIQAAAGVAAAHDRGIVHRDLKPENLFVTREGRIKILDFGLAKILQDGGSGDGLGGGEAWSGATEPGTVLGTVGYMAPEQVRGLGVDQRCDIFALGAIVYEMLCGRRAFQGKTAADVLSGILCEEPPEISGAELPASLLSLERRCLEKDPAERFQSVRDLAFALEAVLEPGALAANSSGTPSPTRSVAVLLFKDLGGQPENEHLSLGLADSIITELAQVQSLVVRPMAATLRYENTYVDSKRTGQELGVDAVVDGSFQRAGSRLRITVQLLSTVEERPLWGTKIDTSLDDIFAMQDEVSRQVVRALGVESTAQPASNQAEAQRVPGEAYDLYLKGKSQLYRRTLGDCHAAIEWFAKARQVDPAFALPWAGLAQAYDLLGFSYDPQGGWQARAAEACEKALELDPDLAEGFFLRARQLWTPERGFQHGAALEQLAAALVRRPNLVEAHLTAANVLLHVGLIGEAERSFRRAREIDPLHLNAYLNEGYCRYWEGAYEDALRITDEVLESVPSSGWGRYQRCLCLLQIGALDEAETDVEESLATFADSAFSRSIHSLVAALRGDVREMERRIEAVARFEEFGHYHHAQYDLGCGYAVLGRNEAALHWLELAVRCGFPCATAFARDPLLKNLREDAEFQRLLGRLETEVDEYRGLYRRLRLGEIGFPRQASRLG